MWYKGQRCRFTQWLVHDLRLRTLQTAGQVDTFSPESSFFLCSLASQTGGEGQACETKDMALHQHMQHRVGITHTTYDLIT